MTLPTEKDTQMTAFCAESQKNDAESHLGYLRGSAQSLGIAGTSPTIPEVLLGNIIILKFWIVFLGLDFINAV